MDFDDAFAYLQSTFYAFSNSIHIPVGHFVCILCYIRLPVGHFVCIFKWCVHTWEALSMRCAQTRPTASNVRVKTYDYALLVVDD